ncbi:MAG: propionate--CoA ligase [Candidatus Lambdaproteobacteria bacterium]|nr:propionate--CoA ligase [Candidatus Lambdaproteobacteria bacterium]
MPETYAQRFRRSIAERESYWAEEAEAIHWHRRWERVLDYDRPPFARWFVGGETNLCHNMLDRHLPERADQRAIVWVSAELGKTEVWSYRELYARVQRYAAVFRDLGVGKGDRIIIYLPMIPEALAAMMACVRLGAIHSVVFGGFAPANLAQRIDDARPKLIVTADAGIRAGKVTPYKPLVDRALELARHPPARLLLIRRGLDPHCAMKAGRDLDLAELAEGKTGAPIEPVWVESSHPSYILYTSGTTGLPKGVQRDTGGSAVSLVHSLRRVYDARPGETYWATSDIGWVVGHSYIVYAPLLHGMTTIVYEGTPVTPDPGIWWRIVEEHKVNVMFSAPTAIRILRKQDPKYMRAADVGSLRYLFLAGEPLDEPTYHWVNDNLKRTVINHYWQTESGTPMLANCAGVELRPIKPGSPSFPVFGYDLKVVEPVTGRELPPGEKGVLVAKPPLPPGALSTVWGNDQRFLDSYYGHFPELLYYSGDFAIRDQDNYHFVLGRADEVINVAGHRLGTGEIEEAISGHPAVAEAAAVGVHDEIKGQAVVAFVVLKNEARLTPAEAEAAIKKQVDDVVGPIARPREVHLVPALPKTRSGKVIRRAIQAMAEGRDAGDLSTLEDPAAVAGIEKAVKGG